MKIVQIISHYLPAIGFGGPLHVAHGLGQALVEAGHEVTVCTTSMQDPESNLDVPFGEVVYIDGVRVIYEPVKRARYWGFSSRFLKRMYKEISQADIVFTHFHYQFASMGGGWCARVHNKPYIVFTHGSLNHHGIQARHSFLKLMYLRVFEASNFKRALFTAYHSEVEQQQSYAFGVCSHIISIGVDPALAAYMPVEGRFKERYSELRGRFVFSYLGRLAPGKGLDLLLPAFRILLDQGHDAHLVLIGGNERGYRDVLLEKVKTLRLEQRVIFTGLLSGENKFDALADADVFVLPSRSEGTSIVTLEAMALGIPVLISDRVGLASEVLEHQCGVVIPYDEQSLTQALMDMIKREDRAEMGRRAVRLVRTKYDWSSITQGLLEKIAREMA